MYRMRRRQGDKFAAMSFSSCRVPLLALSVLIGGSGCLFSGTRSARKAEAISKAQSARDHAVKSGDFATAIAYDDQFLRSGAANPEVQADRSDLFRRMIRQHVDKLGPVRDDNVEAIVRTLIGFRREAERDLSVSAEYSKPAGTAVKIRASIGTKDALRPEVDPLAAARSDKASAQLRQTSLAAVDASVIKPALVAADDPLARVIDAAAARADFERAVILATGATVELAPGSTSGARLATVKALGAAAHIERATKAGDQLAGARVLNARIAAVYGGDPGVLAEPGPTLAAAALPNWTIVSPGDCGESRGLDDVPGQTLEAQLRGESYPAGPGSAQTLTVTFDSCPSKAETTTTTTEHVVGTKVISVPTTHTSCGSGVTYSTKTVQGTMYDTEITTVTQPGCTQTTTYKDQTVNITETDTTSHTVHTMVAKGTIQIAFEGGVRQAPFELSVRSDSFRSYDASPRRTAQPSRGESIQDVRKKLHAALLVKIRGVTAEVLAAREAAYVAKLSAGPSLEADHAFFLASQIASTLEPADAFQAMASPILAAAVVVQPLPKIDLGATHRLTLPVVSIDATYSVETEMREIRGFIMLSLTGGVASASTTGGMDSSTGGIASLAVSMFPHTSRKGGGFRISGGKADSWLMDIDFYGGYGFRLGWLSMSAVAGIGLDFTPGNQDGIGPTPGSFILPVGGYVEYGARIGYPSAYGSLELMYTKAFRTSSAMSSEKRGDIRLAAKLVAVTLRYVEYLDDVDGFFTPFSANDERIAKMFWILGGIGF